MSQPTIGISLDDRRQSMGTGGRSRNTHLAHPCLLNDVLKLRHFVAVGVCLCGFVSAAVKVRICVRERDIERERERDLIC